MALNSMCAPALVFDCVLRARISRCPRRRRALCMRCCVVSAWLLSSLASHLGFAPSLSMMRHELQQQSRSLYPQQHPVSPLGISSFEGAAHNHRTTSHTVASSPAEVFSPPSVGQAMMEGSPFLRVASPLTPVSVSPNMFPSSPSSNLSSKHALGSEFEVSSAWGGTGLHQTTAVGITSNAIKSESVLKSRCLMIVALSFLLWLCKNAETWLQ